MSKALELFSAASSAMQEQVSEHLAKITNIILEAVFDHPYTVSFHFESKGSRVECSIAFERDGHVQFDCLNSIEGGVQDCVAFALRLSVGLLQAGKSTPIFVFDEPFRFIHSTRRRRLLEVVESLVESHGLQIIWVTHDPEFVAGNVIALDGMLPGS